MRAQVARVRMFAGPNGSGKSTLFRRVLHAEWQGIYLNPDDIEKEMRATGFLDFAAYGVTEMDATVLASFRESPLVRSKKGLEQAAALLSLEGTRVYFPFAAANSYFASVASDIIRHRLLAAGASFTFETVMSSPDKVEFLRKAQAAGFRTYLYYIATDDPAINQARVDIRVSEGGHSVPPDKIESRYYKSLELLPVAIRASHRAYVFDNSGDKREHTWLAEITDGKQLELKSEVIPGWFKKAVLDPLAGSDVEL